MSRRTFTLSALLALALFTPVTHAKNALQKATSYTSADENFSIKLKGRIHVDAATYNDDVTVMDGDVELRRLRLGFSGSVMKDWIYSYDYDSESSLGFRTKGAYIGYKGFKKLNIKVGNLQQPFSLEELTSSNHIPFMERSLAHVFAPSYHLGVLFNTWGKNWSLAGGYFDDTLADKRNDNDGSHSLAFRGTFNPIDQKTFKIHLGASAVFRNLDANQTVSFSTRPESHPTNSRLLSTGTLRDVEDIEIFGLEAAVIRGPWLLQAELMRAKLDRTTRPDPSFDGGYIQASWIITGEKQRYSGKSGIMKQIKPKSKYGAIELAVRYSTLDLEEKTVTGGEEDNITLGINWHINRNMRVMANYIDVKADPNRNGIIEDVNILQMRFQAYF